MTSRRAFVRGAAALGVGGVLGALPGAAAAAPPEPTPFHATGLTADADTTLTARFDPSLPSTVGVPDGLGSAVADLRERYSSVDPAAFGPVTASVGIDDGRIAGGCAVAEGAVAEATGDAGIRRALSSDGAAAFEDAGLETRFDHGAVPKPGYAVGTTDSTLAVGHGPSDAAAIDHAAAGARYAGENTGDGVAPVAFSGDAVAYAALGDGTRSRLRSRADGSIEGLDALIGAAEAFGVAVEVGGTESRLRYGVVADPSSLSVGEVRSLARRAADGEGALDAESVSGRGRLLVAEATVRTDAFWDAHGRVLGALSG